MKLDIKKIVLLGLFIFTPLFAEHNVTESTVFREQEFGIGALYRTATVPYRKDLYSGGTSVSTVIPFLYYPGETFYLDYTELGLHLFKSDSWRASVFARLRFADFPKDVQNVIQEDTYDPGVQLRYSFEKDHHVDLELMSDHDGNYYINLAYEKKFDLGDLEITPYAEGTYRSADFNSKYYGLNINKLNAGVDFTLGAFMRYSVYGNMYFLADAKTKFLSNAATNSTFVKKRRQDELTVGIGFYNEKKSAAMKILNMKPFLKIAYGSASPSTLNNIVIGKREKDEYNNKLSSVFYGYPLADTLFSLPIESYITPGFVWHHSSKVQDNIQEYVIAFKAFYTLPLPWAVRLGIAEGLSYINEPTYIERHELEEKDYQPSKLMNHLALSIDLSLGDIFGKKLEGLWLGYDIHHRSAIFESSSQFGRIKGGSNYTTGYLQYHF